MVDTRDQSIAILLLSLGSETINVASRADEAPSKLRFIGVIRGFAILRKSDVARL